MGRMRCATHQRAPRLPPDAVLAMECHGVAELRVGTAAAAEYPGGRRRGAG